MQMSHKHCSSRNSLCPDEGVSSLIYLSWSWYPFAGYINLGDGPFILASAVFDFHAPDLSTFSG